MKFVPLSVMMLCGTPNLKMIDLMKLTTVRAVELVMGTASIHLVNFVDCDEQVCSSAL